MADRYQFTNYTSEPFTGRYGGVDYFFAPGETKEFDPDKHYMLILLAKQLADRELLRGIKRVGRNPNDEETFGESLDANGEKYNITTDMRRDIMKNAIGDLVDKPIPIPDDVEPEAGTTQQASEDVKDLKDKVQKLTEMVESLTSAIKNDSAPVPSTTLPPTLPEAPAAPDRPAGEPSMGTTREVLYEMALEAGLAVHEGNTKEELVGMLNKLNQTQVAA